ncbi:MAG: DUF429 domain-containing protein [Bacteroidetes bacterium]|nr:DUF429 domain-containing protein [Bacteroidota bacterium]
MPSDFVNQPNIFYGIDGCKTGWILATFQRNSLGFELNVSRLPTLFDLRNHLDFSNLNTIWIDIPLGLSETEERFCDKQLRKALGKKGASAFATPIKCAVYATTYQEASNLNFEQTGKKISIQSWNICPKIKEADEFLEQNPDLKSFIKESHPEYLFQSWRPDYFESKKTEIGFIQRLEFLDSYLTCSEVVNSFIKMHKRTLFAKDDVTDALALVFAAFQSSQQDVSYFGDENYKIYFPID